MMIWSYFATFLSDPGLVPTNWTPFELPTTHQSTDDLETGSLHQQYQHFLSLDAELIEQQLLQQSQNIFHINSLSSSPPSVEDIKQYLERPRYCKKCKKWKPPRAHHCSVTGACVVKMDHYCVWVLNCVGLLNYKQFLLFLIYALLACLMSAAMLVQPCIDFVGSPSAQQNVGTMVLAFLSFVFCAAFSLALIGFLIMHTRLVVINHTSIEAYEKEEMRPWPYDYGSRKNFEEVFGSNNGGGGWWWWVVPMHKKEVKEAMIQRYLSYKLAHDYYEDHAGIVVDSNSSSRDGEGLHHLHHYNNNQQQDVYIEMINNKLA